MPKIAPAASEASLPPGMRIMGTSTACCLCDLKPWAPSCSKQGAGPLDRTRSCPGYLGWGLFLISAVVCQLCTQPSPHTLLRLLPWTAPIVTCPGPLTPPSPNKFPPSMASACQALCGLGRLAVLCPGKRFRVGSGRQPLPADGPPEVPSPHTSVRCLGVRCTFRLPKPLPIAL